MSVAGFVLTPLFWFQLWHGWLMPLPSWAPPEHAILAAEERFYRNTDATGYLRFIEVTRAYGIPILVPDKESAWFKALPDFVQGSAMFVYDTSTIWVNNPVQQDADPGWTMAVVEHELCHVLGRWHPEGQVKTEGIAAPPVDILNWRTWAEHEIYCSNIMLRVARRLGSATGQQFALDVARGNWEDMSAERRERFLATYDWWLDRDILLLAGG